MDKIDIIDHGFVRSLVRIEASVAHGYTVDVQTGDIYGLKYQRLIPQQVASGHCVVTLQTPGWGRRGESVLAVHVLIAYAKFGRAAFRTGLEIRHLNNIPNDNRGENIAYGTRCQNILDIPSDVRSQLGIARTRHRVGKPNCNRKLSDDDIRTIRRRSTAEKRGIISRLAKEYDVSHSRISYIARGLAYESVR